VEAAVAVAATNPWGLLEPLGGGEAAVDQA